MEERGRNKVGRMGSRQLSKGERGSDWGEGEGGGNEVGRIRNKLGNKA